MVMLHGVDVSNYQKDWAPLPGDTFVGIKATEGRTYTSPAMAQQTERARKAGLVVMQYHYMWPGNPLEQAAYFVKQAKPLPGDLLVCDWERAGTTNADKDIFIKEVKRLAPQCRVGLYCNTSWWLNTDKTNFYGDFLWIADYRTGGVAKDGPPIKTQWTFWQYSDTPIDQNWCRFTTKDELVTWARGLIPPPPPLPKPVPVPPKPTPKPVKYKEVPFWITQFNILKPEFANKGTLPWTKRLPLIVKALKATKSSIFILNECGMQEAADIAKAMGEQWTWDRLVNNVVMRDKNKWKEVKLIEAYLSGPKAGNRRTLVGVKLQHYQNPKLILTVGSTHLETLAAGYAKTEAEAQALRDAQAKEIVKALGGVTLTVIGGDLNDRDVTTGPVKIFKDAGFKLLDESVKVAGPAYSTDGHHLIDRVFHSPDVKVTEARRVDPGLASDHLLTTARMVALIPLS